MRLFEGGVVLNLYGVEHRHVGKVTWLKSAPLFDLQNTCRQGGKTANGFLQRNHFLVAHILTEEPASESKLTHGSLICFRTFSSDIMK